MQLATRKPMPPNPAITFRPNILGAHYYDFGLVCAAIIYKRLSAYRYIWPGAFRQLCQLVRCPVPIAYIPALCLVWQPERPNHLNACGKSFEACCGIRDIFFTGLI